MMEQVTASCRGSCCTDVDAEVEYGGTDCATMAGGQLRHQDEP